MKIEFDLPEFDKEIKVEITIRKDGEVVYTSSSSSPSCFRDLDDKSQDKPEEKAKPAVESKFSGNLMGMDF